ncbi:hypothetical protein N0V87_008869 [Didymella glomerata]|uniref:Uncharacterized protein n=1 Tax=Didymella glomerata TaxID=749621 RepID=A0A9W8WSQ4_9PLEO|nr:hypothetical protein N0V87_008869 [Didymella glomerata]
MSSAYPSQQSPYSQANSSNGQSNYFAPPGPATPQTAYGQPTPPPPQSSQSSYNVTQYSQSTTFQSPAEFIAELPADLVSLSIAETRPADHPAAPTPGHHSPYQAYQASPAPPGPSSPGFTVARRAVSVSSAPYADPWRFADPLTELPTREFYVIADLLFEALDRKFEPQNTGMLEASKVMKSWIDLSEDATPLCSETHKPGVLHHPDLTKRDKAEAPVLQSRAAEIQAAAINQVCFETKAAMHSH